MLNIIAAPSLVRHGASMPLPGDGMGGPFAAAHDGAVHARFTARELYFTRRVYGA
jgi:hypothetical protein